MLNNINLPEKKRLICNAFSTIAAEVSLRRDRFAAKEKTYAVVGEFLNEFKVHYGSVACTELLGYNLLDPQQFADAKTHKVAIERCPTFIRGAVELVETLM